MEMKTAATPKKKQNKPVYIPKPFLRGKPWDSLCLKTSLAMLGGYLMLMLAFLLLGMLMIIDNTVIRVALNVMLLAGSYLIYFSFGMGNGTQAVNQGEILQNRVDTGRPINKGEQECCYHPLKGFLVALVGYLPALLLAVVFACITTRQMTTMGALPSWISSLNGHSEITGPLAYYTASASFSLQDILRIFVRMNIMPWVNIFDSSNMDNMLMVERFAPLLMLLPPLFYGLGYTQGPRSRARIHGDIAQGRRKAAKKARKEHKKKVQTREPQQLN